LTFDIVSAQSQGFQTCSFAKASSKVKNPRSAPLHHFCQCSKGKIGRLPEALRDEVNIRMRNSETGRFRGLSISVEAIRIDCLVLAEGQSNWGLESPQYRQAGKPALRGNPAKSNHEVLKKS